MDQTTEKCCPSILTLSRAFAIQTTILQAKPIKGREKGFFSTPLGFCLQSIVLIFFCYVVKANDLQIYLVHFLTLSKMSFGDIKCQNNQQYNQNNLEKPETITKRSVQNQNNLYMNNDLQIP